jgi:hypothetical protein
MVGMTTSRITPRQHIVAFINQPKAFVSSEGYHHVFTTTKIRVNNDQMIGGEGNIWMLEGRGG